MEAVANAVKNDFLVHLGTFDVPECSTITTFREFKDSLIMSSGSLYHSLPVVQQEELPAARFDVFETKEETFATLQRIFKSFSVSTKLLAIPENRIIQILSDQDSRLAKLRSVLFTRFIHQQAYDNNGKGTPLLEQSTVPWAQFLTDFNIKNDKNVLEERDFYINVTPEPVSGDESRWRFGIVASDYKPDFHGQGRRKFVIPHLG